jgi:uncharacterized protein YegL
MDSTDRQKVEPTNIIFAFDVSGSMIDLLKRLIHSFNTEILASQKKTFLNAVDIDGIVPENELCCVSMITFSGSNQINVLHKDIPITEMEEIKHGQLVAEGLTALRTTIVFIDDFRKTLKYPNRKTMIFILTDGEDTNSLREHSPSVVREIFQRYELTKLEDPKHCISATLIGSNQDAVLTGGSMGLPQTNALTFNDDNIGDAMSSIGRMVSRVVSGEECSPSINADDRVRSCPGYTPNSLDFIVVNDRDY